LPTSTETKLRSPARSIETLSSPRGSETILLVEDEKAVRRSIGNILAHHGYHIHTAVSGAAALGIWRKHRESIHLMITDLVMPGNVSGRALFDRMRSARPDLKVIFCSGYTDDVLGHDAPLRQAPNFIEKPFAPEKLLRKVRVCLDAEE
jgi:DNA-binding NtrC family response regulator